ncbi:MAG: ECF-type sigma factor [Singulisphaera sp.]
MGTDDDRAAWTTLVLLERFRSGDDLAAAEIFDRYFQRLTALARSRLSPRLAQRTDRHIVLSVYRSFFVDAAATPEPRGRSLEALAAITKHKLLRQVRASAGRRSVEAEIPSIGSIKEAPRRQPIPPPKTRSHWPTSWNGCSRISTSSGGGCWNSGCGACESRRSRRTRTAPNAPCDDHSPGYEACWRKGTMTPDEEFESRVLRFEEAWRLRGPREIADHLGDLSPSAGPERYRSLVDSSASTWNIAGGTPESPEPPHSQSMSSGSRN